MPPSRVRPPNPTDGARAPSPPTPAPAEVPVNTAAAPVTAAQATRTAGPRRCGIDVVRSTAMWHGCGFFRVSVSCGEMEAGLVAAEMVAVVFLGDMPVPVGVQVAVGADGAEPQDGLGAGQAPAGAGDAHPVLHEVAAGSFDDAGGDRPASRQGGGIVQVRLLGLEVVQGRADDLGVLAAGPGRVLPGQVPDLADDAGDPAVQDVQPPGRDPGPDRGVPRGVKAPGGLPQVPDHVDEIDQDDDGDAAGGGLAADHLDLVIVPVRQGDPGPGVPGVAALGLIEDGADGRGAVRGDV